MEDDQQQAMSGLGRLELLGVLGPGAGLAALGGEFGATLGAQRQARSARIPRGTIIRTVAKDIAPDDLRGGATLMHEHHAPRQPAAVRGLRAEGLEGFRSVARGL
jgi:hypothetical protein